MTLAEWIDTNVKERFSYAGDSIIVAGQKDGSYNSTDAVFEIRMSQVYAKEIFGRYNMMFFNPIIYDSAPMIRVCINIPTPEEMKNK